MHIYFGNKIKNFETTLPLSKDYASSLLVCVLKKQFSPNGAVVLHVSQMP
jgi:hypothetical protein